MYAYKYFLYATSQFGRESVTGLVWRLWNAKQASAFSQLFDCGMYSSNGVDFLLTLPELNNIQVISMVLLAYLFSLGFP